MGHKHRWTPIKKGFPQRVCECGLMAVKELKIGKNTITLSPLGSSDDTMRFSSLGAPTTVSQLAMSPSSGSGRPLVRQGAVNRRLRMADEAFAKKFWRFNQNPGTLTITNVNSTATITTAGVGLVVSASGGQFISYSSAGDNGWANTAFDETQRQGFPTFVCFFRTGPVITSVNYHIGLVSSDPFVGTPHMGAVRFNTGAGDTFWTAVTGNGVSVTATSLGLAPVANTNYLVRIQFTTTGVVFQIATSAVQPASVTISSTLPGLTTLLGTFARVRALAGSRDIGISHVNIAENNPYL